MTITAIIHFLSKLIKVSYKSSGNRKANILLPQIQEQFQVDPFSPLLNFLSHVDFFWQGISFSIVDDRKEMIRDMGLSQ